jgi:hypothetical protein
MIRLTSALLLSISCALSQNTVPLSINNSVPKAISVLINGTEEYNTALPTLIPLRSQPEYSAIYPYSVILKNISTEPLLGTVVVFEIEHEDGSVGRYVFASLTRDPTSLTAVLPPNSYRFVSASSNANRAVVDKQSEYVHRGTISLEALASSLSRSRRITVVIDSVITANGTLIGL